MNDKSKLDYQDFLEKSEVVMPDSISNEIIQHIASKLNPSIMSVFNYLLVIYGLAGFLAVYFCPQLGVGFSSSSVLVNIFMTYGHQVCTLMCGAFYLSLGTVFSLIFLPKEHRSVFLKKSYLFIISIALVSLMIFLLLGANEKFIHYIYWLIGGTISGYVITKSTALVLEPKGLAL